MNLQLTRNTDGKYTIWLPGVVPWRGVSQNGQHIWYGGLGYAAVFYEWREEAADAASLFNSFSTLFKNLELRPGEQAEIAIESVLIEPVTNQLTYGDQPNEEYTEPAYVIRRVPAMGKSEAPQDPASPS